LAAELDASSVPLAEMSSEGDDLLLLALPEQALGDIAEELSARRQARIALHTAGSTGGEILAPLRRRGTSIGSLHPLRAFAGRVPYEQAAGTFFAIDGDAEAQELAQRLAGSWSSSAVPIPPESRAIYHLAATLAAGGVVTLVAAACHLAEEAGTPRDVRDGYISLAEGALANLRSVEEPAAAITGPAARGEVLAVEQQIEQLKRFGEDRSGSSAPGVLDLLLTLVEQTVRCRADAGQPVENEAALLRLIVESRSPRKRL